jgi:peptidoglycan/LPS O-acetylase OafA/YrhL
MIGIFLHHVSFFNETKFALYYKNIFYYGDTLVTVFFVISGFSITLKYFHVFNQISWNTYWIYIRKRLLTLYPLYLMTFFLSFPVSDSFYPSTDAYGKIVSYLTMTQIYIPIDRYFFSFNSLSWYVSCLMALYLIYPFIIYIIHKLQIMTYVRLGILLFIVWMGSFIFSSNYVNSDFNTSYWILYVMPTGRIFNFISGIIACIIFLNTRRNILSLKHNILEIIVLFAFIISLTIIPYIPKVYLLSFYLMPFITILLIIFSPQKGYISKLIGNKYISLFGGLVYPFFMFHQLVIRYIITYKAFSFTGVSIIYISFFTTILLSSFYIVLRYIFVRIYRNIIKKPNE